jgi:hypothetical protein
MPPPKHGPLPVESEPKVVPAEPEAGLPKAFIQVHSVESQTDFPVPEANSTTTDQPN